MKPIARKILLNPGPATTTDRVKYAQVVPDICPREKEFGLLMQEVANEITRIVAPPSQYTTVLFCGSGTAAVESIISSVVDTEAVLIINNGAYGKRMLEIAEVYGLNTLEFKSEPDQALDLSALDNFILNSSSKISHLAVVHNETSTGLLNCIESIGMICENYKIDLIVDAMSSFAAIPINMQEMNISYIAASSNKNLQGMAGISFVVADINKLEGLQNHPRRNYYLDLYEQYKYFLKTNQMRFTPPVQTFYALQQAIMELKQEGTNARYHRYTESWNTLRHGLFRLGLRHIVNERHHSKLVTSIVEPECPNYDFNDMHDFFYNHGFTIYPGKVEECNTFRIANIGDITSIEIEEFLGLLGQYLNKIGYLMKGG